jgi:hypothetical protein
VAELQQRMSSEEFSEWIAFATIEPFGFEADFLGHAQTAAVIANVNRGEKGQVREVRDFMPRLSTPEPQSAEAMKATAAAITATMEALNNGDNP